MERFAVSDRTIDRWLIDPTLDFPKPLRINNRRYWKYCEILAWERARESAGPTARRKAAATTEAAEGSDDSLAYSERHGVKAQACLTVATDEEASLIAEHLAPRIEGKTVVEIGGGIGLLAMHMGLFAKRVYCIEANPMWSWAFSVALLKRKPRNVSFLFGAADEFLGAIKGDVAVYCTHSDVAGMGLVARQFAPEVIEVYGEIIDAAPERFDAFARVMRKVV